MKITITAEVYLEGDWYSPGEYTVLADGAELIPGQIHQYKADRLLHNYPNKVAKAAEKKGKSKGAKA